MAYGLGFGASGDAFGENGLGVGFGLRAFGSRRIHFRVLGLRFSSVLGFRFGVGFTLQGCQLCGVLGVVPSSELSDFRQPNTVTPQEKLMRAIRIISRDC